MESIKCMKTVITNEADDDDDDDDVRDDNECFSSR